MTFSKNGPWNSYLVVFTEGNIFSERNILLYNFFQNAYLFNTVNTALITMLNVCLLSIIMYMNQIVKI